MDPNGLGIIVIDQSRKSGMIVNRDVGMIVEKLLGMVVNQGPLQKISMCFSNFKEYALGRCSCRLTANSATFW